MSEERASTTTKPHALRLVWMDVKANEFKNYEAVTFPRDPQAGCGMYLRRARLFEAKPEEKSPYTLDTLDENGDIIDEMTLTRAGFRYMVQQLRTKREYLEQERTSSE